MKYAVNITTWMPSGRRQIMRKDVEADQPGEALTNSLATIIKTFAEKAAAEPEFKEWVSRTALTITVEPLL
jgi:hypothetical protein